MSGMGSTHTDIWTALEAFADHCDRSPLDRRPTYWAQYVDVWGEPKGELGVSNPPTVDDPKRDSNGTVFAVLTPWLAIPTMATAWLVVDNVDQFYVVRVWANSTGFFTPVWSVVYRFEDDGHITPAFPEPIPMPGSIGSGIAAALKARKEQKLWEGDYDITTVVPVVEGLLNE